MKRWASALILAWGMAVTLTAQAASGLEHARNFKLDGHDAGKRQVPVMVLFSSPNCHYCERVKREYLVPMHRDKTYRSKVIIREVTIGSTAPLVEFNGATATEGAFAAAHKIFMVPTVMVFNPQGKATGEAIVGLLTPDYYFGYLETAIEDGLRATRGK